MVERKGRNGGTLKSMEKGDKTLPGAGRPPKSDILEEVFAMMESDNGYVVVEGDLLDADDKPTGQMVKVRARIANGKKAAQAWMTKLGKADKGHLELFLKYKYGLPKQQLEHSGPDGKDLFPQFANQPIQVEILKTTE